MIQHVKKVARATAPLGFVFFSGLFILSTAFVGLATDIELSSQVTARIAIICAPGGLVCTLIAIRKFQLHLKV